MAGWSAERVIEEMARAFRVAPETPILCHRSGTLCDAVTGAPLAAAAWVTVVQQSVGHESQAAKMLLAYVSYIGNGRSIADLCRDKGWARTTVTRRCREAAAVVAASLEGCAACSFRAVMNKPSA